jgi:hypothetical protein
MSDHPLVWPLEAARLYEVLWQRLRRRFPQEDEALLEDAITQALELLVTQPGRYTPQRGSLLSWLWGVAWRRLHHLRRQRVSHRRREVPLELGIEGAEKRVARCPVSGGVGEYRGRGTEAEASDSRRAAVWRWWAALGLGERVGLWLLAASGRRGVDREALWQAWVQYLGLAGRPRAEQAEAIRRAKGRLQKGRQRVRRKLLRQLGLSEEGPGDSGGLGGKQSSGSQNLGRCERGSESSS